MTMPRRFPAIKTCFIFALMAGLAGTEYDKVLAQGSTRQRSDRVLSGYVQERNGVTVPDIVIGIHGASSVKTKDHGDFSLPLPATIQIGFVISLYVEDGWIVTEPTFNGMAGCPLPMPSGPPMRVVVSKVGDRSALLSDSAIEAMLLGSTSHFGKLTGTQRQSITYAGRARFVNSEFLVDKDAGASERSKRAQAYFASWLSDQATVLGIEKGEIESAISSWMMRKRSGLDRGLGELYRGDLKSATASLLSVNVESTGGQSSHIFANQALAFTFALDSKYSAAEELLQKTFDETGRLDPNMLLHLGNVLEMDGKPNEARHAFQQAHEILEANGLNSSLGPVSASAPPSTTTPIVNSSESPALISMQVMLHMEQGDPEYIREHLSEQFKNDVGEQKWQDAILENSGLVGICSGQPRVMTRLVENNTEYIASDKCAVGISRVRLQFNERGAISRMIISPLSNASEEEIKYRARMIVSALASGNFQEVVSNFNAKMRAFMSLEQLSQFWKVRVAGLGSFAQIGGLKKDPESDLVTVKCDFEGGEVTIKLFFEPSLSVTGLRIE